VLLVIGVPLAILFLRTHERVTQLEHLPPQGEASYNPLYVLGQALRADGLTVQSQPRLDLARMPLQPGDTLVLLQDSAEVPAPAATALMAWVARGGHLIVRTPPVGKEAVRLISENGGFQGELQGTIERINPQVRQREVLSTDPTGDADARIVEVRVRLDPADARRVRSLTGLKVIARLGA
jgi:hypothetical protein